MSYCARMLVPRLLSTAQAARLAHVGPSTLKRWADAGRLSSLRTAGGHRRFRRMDIERLVREERLVGSATSSRRDPILDALVRGVRHELDAALLEARARLGSWYAVADDVGATLTELGERWQRAEFTIADEHAASHHLLRALGRVADTMPGPYGEAPSCVLACPADEEHVLGLALAELCLRELGWRPLWLGRRTPVDEIVGLLEAEAFDAVALSASSFASQADALERVVDVIGARCEALGVGLVLGGTGAWPSASRHGDRLTTFAQFHRWLADRSERR